MVLRNIGAVPTKTYSNEVVTLWYRPPDVLLGSTEYTTSIDMWGVGCIFFEMASGRPLFPGSTVEDELHLIFRTLGTPTERKWKGITKKEEFLSFDFPQYESESLFNRVPRLDSEGMDLLMRFLRVWNTFPKLLALQHIYCRPLTELVVIIA